MSRPTDAGLYLRGRDTLLASWEAYARGAVGAAVKRLPGVAAAVFPHEPERAVYNNAFLGRDRANRCPDAMEAVYAAAGITRFAWVTHPAWAPGWNSAVTPDTTTRAMAALDDIRVPRLDPLGPVGWAGTRGWTACRPDFEHADHAAFHPLAPLDGEMARGGWRTTPGGDSGIYNVGTVEQYPAARLAPRYRLVHDAQARGTGPPCSRPDRRARVRGRLPLGGPIRPLKGDGNE
jgi:hypothetical protein